MAVVQELLIAELSLIDFVRPESMRYCLSPEAINGMFFKNFFLAEFCLIRFMGLEDED